MNNRIKTVAAFLIFLLLVGIGGGLYLYHNKGYDVINCHSAFVIKDINRKSTISGNLYIKSQKGAASIDVVGQYVNGEGLYHIDRTILIKIIPRRLYGNTMISEPEESHHYSDNYEQDISPILFGINNKGFTTLYSKRVKDGVYILGDSYAPRFICSEY